MKTLPEDTDLPVRTENQVVEFEYGGKFQRVELPPNTWGMRKEARRGMEIVTERGDDGARRTRLDVSQLEMYIERVLSNAVNINGVTWAGHRVDELDPRWCDAFRKAYEPEAEDDLMEATRKKSRKP